MKNEKSRVDEIAENKSSLVNPIEKRSKRTSVIIPPSIHKRTVEKGEKLGISFNEIVNQLLEKFVNEI